MIQDAAAAILTGSVHSSSQTTLPWTVDDLRATYERWSSADDRLDLAVIDKATNAMVGEVVLNDWNELNRSCGFRTFLAAEGRGRGLLPPLSPPVTAMLRNGFGTLTPLESGIVITELFITGFLVLRLAVHLFRYGSIEYSRKLSIADTLRKRSTPARN